MLVLFLNRSSCSFRRVSLRLKKPSTGCGAPFHFLLYRSMIECNKIIWLSIKSTSNIPVHFQVPGLTRHILWFCAKWFSKSFDKVMDLVLYTPFNLGGCCFVLFLVPLWSAVKDDKLKKCITTWCQSGIKPRLINFREEC